MNPQNNKYLKNIIKTPIIGIVLFFLLIPIRIFAYDAEINGLRYDWTKTHNETGREYIWLVGYNSSKISENLDIPYNVKWESRDNRDGKQCVVQKISKYAFQNCSLLKSVKINGSFIDSYSFENCSSLKTLYLTAYSLNAISSNAFIGCSSLTEIHITNDNPPSIAEDAFTEDAYQSVVLYVPIGCVDKYKNQSGWSKFKTITDGTVKTYTLAISSVGNGSVTYNGESIRSGSKSYTVDEGTNANFSFSPDDGYQIKSIKVNNTSVTLNNSYSTTINSDINIEVEFEAIPPKTYSLTVAASGNGSASYGGETIRSGSKSFTVNEGTNISVSFSPDNGYQIKSIKVNNSNVGSSSSYSTTINGDTNIEVEFEAIPPKTYSLTVAASGNGSASYGGETIRSGSKSFTVNEGTSAKVSFSPDSGYRVKSVKVNGSSVDAGSSYTVTVNSDTKVEVEFEAIPVTKYTLTIKASGNGSASYSGESIRGTTKTYSVNEGSSVSVSFSPDSGYRIKSIKVNNSSISVNTSYSTTMNSDIKVEVEFEAIPVTTYTLTITAVGGGSVSFNDEIIRETTKTYTFNEGTSFPIYFNRDNGYRIKTVTKNGQNIGTAIIQSAVNMKEDITIYVEFEAIPVDPTPTPQPTTYTLSISTSGNGSASYGGESIRGTTKTYTVNEGTSAKISFSPDNGYRVKSVKVNNSSVDAGSSYTVTVNSNTTVAVEFEAIPATTYTLTITASGNGSASYSNETIRGGSKSFTVNEGTRASLSFSPDNGYRVKSVKVNNSSVDAGSSYTVTVNSNTTVSVEFEAIPPTTYTLTITASGNGSVSYGNESIRNTSKSYTVNEGTRASLSFSPDNGYRVKNVKVNNSSVDYGSSYTVTVNSKTTVEVEFEAIPATTYSLTITSSGSGSVSYGNETIRGGSKSFTVNEGTRASLSFSPDNGYRVKSVKVNNSSVDAGNSYTVTVNSNTTVAVEFEAIPVDPTPTPTPTTYTLSISASGNGSASYNGSTIRGTTSSFTINEGTSATISFSPDNGYKIKSVSVNGSTVSAGSSYTVIVNSNTTISVVFEAIPVDPTPTPEPTPTPTTYTFSISASGSGTATYNGTTIRNTNKSFTVDPGTSTTVSFSPDDGCRIASVYVNGVGVSTSSSYTVTVNSNTTVAVEFEAIPITNYTLTVTARGNGAASYNGTSVRNGSRNFSVGEGSSPRVSFVPDEFNVVKTVKLNGSEVSYSDNRYTISNISGDNTLEVEFDVMDTKFTTEGVSYQVSSYENRTVMVGVGDYGLYLEVPEKVVGQGYEWTITGISDEAMSANKDLAAIIWNPANNISLRNINPNLLLYVKDSRYAPYGINNVVVNNVAESIILTESQGSNNFYCPKTFTANKITYSHRYRMRTGGGESKGWETIALPFDVKKIEHADEGAISPFANWTSDSTEKPFWLYKLSASGFVEADGIKANTPYIISMPNNDVYQNDYILRGTVIFSSTNVEVKKSDDVEKVRFGNRTFVPNFINLENNSGYYALNVNNDIEVYQGSENEGSVFIQDLRRIHPFEAYMTSTAATRSIGIFDGMTTAIKGINDIEKGPQTLKVYNLNGQCIKIGSSMETLKQELPAGLYIINNKKIIFR